MVYLCVCVFFVAISIRQIDGNSPAMMSIGFQQVHFIDCHHQFAIATPYGTWSLNQFDVNLTNSQTTNEKKTWSVINTLFPWPFVMRVMNVQHWIIPCMSISSMCRIVSYASLTLKAFSFLYILDFSDLSDALQSYTALASYDFTALVLRQYLNEIFLFIFRFVHIIKVGKMTWKLRSYARQIIMSWSIK